MHIHPNNKHVYLMGLHNVQEKIKINLNTYTGMSRSSVFLQHWKNTHIRKKTHLH